MRLLRGRRPRTQQAIETRLANAKVLIVEDDADVRAALATLLRVEGARPECVGSADEALTLVESWEPDAIVCDIGLPGEDGYALMKRIRALPPPRGRVPAIAATGHTLLEDRIRVLAGGFQHYIAKPIDPNELLAVLKDVLAARA
jgi:CheY-like chemotaxis protein